MITCSTCPSRLQSDWKICPLCGTAAKPEQNQPPGEQFYPWAFEPENYRIGEELAQTSAFYLQSVRYLLAITSDPGELVHFRGRLITTAIL